MFRVIFQKRVRRFHQVSKREKHLRPRGFTVFAHSVWKPDETRSTTFGNYFSNKKISLNYHLNVDDLHNDILESTVIFVGFRQFFFIQSPKLFVMVVSLIDIISV